jgi:hypothetical protein
MCTNATVLTERPMTRVANGPPEIGGGGNYSSAPIGNHTFRATRITAYFANGGAVEQAQEKAPHESPRTTILYDRTKKRLTRDRMKRIRL